jgi:hypothetical protein
MQVKPNTKIKINHIDELKIHLHNASNIFLLDIDVESVIRLLPIGINIFTSSIHCQNKLIERGHSAQYLYSGLNWIFWKAKRDSIKWLTNISKKSKKAANEAEYIFGNAGQIQSWAIIYDSFFEIEGGVFESIYNLRISQHYSEKLRGKTLVLSGSELQLATSLIENYTDEISHIILTNKRRNSLNTFHKLLSILGKFEKVILYPILIKLKNILNNKLRKKSKVIIVSSGGIMSRVRYRGGSFEVFDNYFCSLIDKIKQEYPSSAYVAIVPPIYDSNIIKNTFYKWLSIVQGDIILWYSYITIQDVINNFKHRKKYKEIIDLLVEDPGFISLFDLDDGNFFSLIKKSLKDILPNLLASSLLHSSISHRLLKEENVDLIFSTEAFSNLGRILAHTVHKKNGKLFGIQAGIISPLQVSNIGFFNRAICGFNEFLPDMFFVWGSGYKATLLKYGVSPDIIQVMGFDKTSKIKQLTSQGVSNTIVYVAGSNTDVCPYLMSQEEEIAIINSISSCIPNQFNLIIKLHPRQSIGILEKLDIKSRNRAIVIHNEKTLSEVIIDARIIITKSSTAILEAATLGIPVILVNFNDGPDITGFTSKNFPFLYANDDASINKSISEVLKLSTLSPSFDGFCNEWCAPFEEKILHYLRKS